MKKYLLSAIVFLLFITPAPLWACEQFQTKVQQYTTLKRKGGSARQMNRWQAQKRHYAKLYAECLRNQPRIHSTSVAPRNSHHQPTQHIPRRRTTSDNPITQKLLATCNFWVDSYNRHPNADNKTYRDTACRALDQAEQNPPNGVNNDLPLRPLKECIKPNNLLDDEVHACMHGELKPSWRD